MSEPLEIAVIGCGGRGLTYLSLAAKNPQKYRVVAGADPDELRLDKAERASLNPGFRRFRDADAILSEPRLADVMIIATQDVFHRKHSIAAMEKGYDLLLEKPIAPNAGDVKAIREVAQRLGRRVMVCHVLRYTAFYKKLKSLIDSGILGEVVSINATEGVEAWHQAHSYVRGHWSVRETSSPMILAKSCHDLDIIRWLVGGKCQSLSSYGGLRHFKRDNMPDGAPERCLSGCPVGDACIYNAERYLTDKSWWLFVASLPEDADAATRREWVHASPWGRCVYRCDNDVVDHQTVNLLFENQVTVTFTMTAFEEGRHIEIFGTKARLIAGGRVREGYGCDILIKFHASDQEPMRVSIGANNGGYGSHMGGDSALVDALYEEMRGKDASQMTSSLDVSVESHDIAFAADESRLSGKAVFLYPDT
jgi:predicted dehydrogenase